MPTPRIRAAHPAHCKGAVSHGGLKRSYHGKVTLEADLIETRQLAPDRVQPTLNSNLAGLQVSGGTPGRVASGNLLEKVVRIIFERELRQLIIEGREESYLVEVELDPIDEKLQGLIGKYFPRAGRLATYIYRLLQHGLDKQRLKLRVRREFYRALYRCARLEGLPAPKTWPAAGETSQLDPIGEHFFRLLGIMLGVNDARPDLDRLDRTVRATVDWCVSILPYHQPALVEQDLPSLVTNACRQPGRSQH